MCVTFVLILSLLPQDKIPKAHFNFEDLLIHFIMYFALAFCLCFSLFSYIQKSTNFEIIIAVFVIGIFGFSVEILQKILPINRYFSLEDVLCNFLGATSFYFLALRAKIR